MTYNEAMDYIHEVGNFGSNYGLERTYRLLEVLGNPQKDLKLIHIAGTNGKGSTTAIITELLIEKGYKVGMYTSPYIEEFEERIQINGNNIPQKVLGELMDDVKKAVDIVISEGMNHPTEFEIITCLMFLYFKKEKIDYGVIEVGLGGRLDSTNVITPIISVITSISFDHTNLLGNTLQEIANEKAGIIKNNVPVVIYPQENEAFKVLSNKAKECNSKLTIVDFEKGEFIELVDKDKIYQRIKVNFNKEEFTVDLPLLGEHQIKNLLVALETYKQISEIEGFEITSEEIKEGILKVKWIGRLEILKRNPFIVIDGAHNIQGITSLNNNINKYFKYKNLYLVLGILADKEVEKMVEVIVKNAKKVYALTPHNDRAESSEELRKIILKYNNNCLAYSDYNEALKSVINEADKEDLILISGSLYMIGDVRKILKGSIK
ncbi:MAG: bifunctional folylpolyglutamate synthase/dihydrofolate synthase [Clostridiales bacterium]|nr:bifunctional folylpolyglutamate synthase/dihydrofolate synthase [Clostridiales bacterium]